MSIQHLRSRARQMVGRMEWALGLALQDERLMAMGRIDRNLGEFQETLADRHAPRGRRGRRP